jgi:sugar/nucleoside kinase (ribokinase family)
MVDVVCLGTVSIDLYYKGASLKQDDGRFDLAIGGKYFADHFFEGLGGGGANVAIGIEKNGLDAALIAKIGKGPFKKLITEQLETAKITFNDYCDVETDYTNISSVLLNDKGEKTIINYRSPHQSLISTTEDYKKLIRGKALYMGNLSTVTLKERISVLSYAQKNNVKTFANLNVTDCRRPVEEIVHFVRNVDVLIINSHEYADIVKTSFESIDFQHDVSKKYPIFSQELVLVVTDGAKGSYAYHQGHAYHQKAIHAEKVVDTTGAGDGYTAAFIASYMKSQGDIPKAMKNGAEYAVTILSHLGAN